VGVSGVILSPSNALTPFLATLFSSNFPPLLKISISPNQLMEAQNDIVLNDLSNFLGNSVQDDGTSHHEFSLPPADGGKDALLFLAAGFVVEALVWGQCNVFHSEINSRSPAIALSSANVLAGFPFSFGVFQEYYTTHEPFSDEPSGIAIIGTTATA
jgi:hypothetical protein